MKSKKIFGQIVAVAAGFALIFGWTWEFAPRGTPGEEEASAPGVSAVSADGSVDNVASVMGYSYVSESQTASRWECRHDATVALKDLSFSFCDWIDIPGMPGTREDDFSNNYIFSVSQCPQGICLTDDFVLISSYSDEDDCMGELIVFDRESGEYLVTLGMDEDSHLGGVACDGTNVWLCNSNEKTIERISYDFIVNLSYQNIGGVVDARPVVDSYPVKNVPSCITCHGGRIWVATHKAIGGSTMRAYHYDSANDSLINLSSYKIPAKVQGVAFDGGRVYLSCSYGRGSSSYLYCYPSVTALSASPNDPDFTVEMPPCSEEIDVCDGTLYVIFESAGERYLEGTDGKGYSTAPIDRLLMIPTSELGG